MHKVLVPRENVNDLSVIIRKINFKSGAIVNAGDVIIQIETSKTNIDIEAPFSGVIFHDLLEGIEVEVGAELFVVRNDNAPLDINTHENGMPPTVSEVNVEKRFFSKAALQRMQELSINEASFSENWIDVAKVNLQAGFADTQVKLNQQSLYQEPLQNLIQPPDETRIDRKSIPKRKQAEIRNLTAFPSRSSTSTLGIDINPSNIRITKEKYFLFKESISDLIIYEGSRLLNQFPNLNSCYIDDRYYGQYKEINFGWSFDNGNNLKVLAIKNTNLKSLEQIQDSVIELLDLYDSEGTISPELLMDSTITFTDLSHLDNSFMLPLLNGNQSMILGLIQKSPANYQVIASFDHRVTEGLEVNKYLILLKERVCSHFREDSPTLNIACYACGKSFDEEISMGHRGFILMTLPSGETGNICRSCFDGW